MVAKLLPFEVCWVANVAIKWWVGDALSSLFCSCSHCQLSMTCVSKL